MVSALISIGAGHNVAGLVIIIKKTFSSEYVARHPPETCAWCSNCGGPTLGTRSQGQVLKYRRRNPTDDVWCPITQGELGESLSLVVTIDSISFGVKRDTLKKK